MIRHELATLQEQGSMNAQLILKDTYVFNFLELNDSYLENAILRDLQQLNLFFLNER